MGYAIGIDLGTTYSAVAVVNEAGIPEILPNSEGKNTTPSVVLFPESATVEEPLVGEMAKRTAASSPEDVVTFVKRQMGNPDYRFTSTNGNSYSAEEISAIILKKIKSDAEMALGEEVTDAVITVPAYFDDARRVATKQAGRIAGLNVLRVLNEPTAAAISYGMSSETTGCVLVYDLGGGTFDVTIMEINGGSFNVLSTNGDRNLGGFDFDNRIIEECIAQLEAQGAGENLNGNDELIASMREKAELAKISLSNVKQTSIIIPYNGKQYRLKITREHFEEITRDLLNRTRDMVEDALDAAEKMWCDIDRVLLIGGSTRMPMVREMMKQLSGKHFELDVNPDEAVALGAAIQATLCEQEKNRTPSTTTCANSELMPVMPCSGMPIIVSDVTSQALGVIMLDATTEEEKNYVIIPRNAKIPAKGNTSGSTVVDYQRSINVKVTQGEEEDIRYCVVIGSKEIPVPPYPKGAPLTISYAYDIDQTVYVEVFDDTAHCSLGTFEVDRVLNLSEEEVSQAIVKINGMDIT